MRILLDTNAYSDLKKGTRWVREVATAAEVWMSATVLGELRFGFGLGKRKAKNLRELEEFLEDPAVNPAVIGDSTATLYGDLKRYLRAKGTPIPENDIWIAASCVEHGALLLTADRHFEKLPQVQVIRPED
jgi:tRNA(fMet)-specific endonuclease VapC